MEEKEELDDESIGIKPFLDKFVDDLTLLAKDSLEYVRENCAEVIETADCNLIASLLKLLSAFFVRSNLNFNKIDNAEVVMRLHLCYSIIWSIGGNIEENMRKSRDNIDFLEACEIELEHRLIKMKTKDFIEFSRILTLNQTRKYQNFELFSSYLELFLEKINKLKEDELISIVKNLRFFKDFPDNFFEKFEREIQKTQISEYKNPRNLFLLLIFIHNSSMKLRSNLIQNLLLSINKNSMKSVTNSTYKSLLEFGKNRDKMSLIFNDLIFLVAFEVEESEFLENSDFPKEILKVYQEKILKKEKTKHFDKQKLIANIKEINNIHDFMKILAISNQINLKDLGVLNSLFEVFKKILKYIEINITQFGEILRVFQELNYYIDPSKNPEIFSVFFETINKKTHNFKVFEIYQLIKVLSVYIRLELDKDSVISRKFIETFQFISEKCIKDRVFFIFNERVELLKFLSFSKETCKSPLVQYLFSYFSFGSNHYFITEQENLMKNDFLNRIVERIMNMRADIEKLPIDLQNLLKKTQKFGGKEVISDNFNENASMNWLKSEVIQYLGLLGLIADDKFVIEENVKEFSYDFDVKLKSQIAGKNDIYLDFLSRDYHCHVNFKSQATAFIIAKIDYLKTVKKVHYNYISDFEWETLDKKDLLSEKLSPFLY